MDARLIGAKAEGVKISVLLFFRFDIRYSSNKTYAESSRYLRGSSQKSKVEIIKKEKSLLTNEKVNCNKKPK